MSGNKKLSTLKTPIAFNPTIFNRDCLDDEPIISEKEDIKMRKILKGYNELNKLLDLCLQRIKNRNEE